MRTKATIVAIGLFIIGCVVAVSAFVTAAFGWVGLLVCASAAGLVWLDYLRLVRPWHARWGATDEEVAMTLPGDDIIPTAAVTTRAISIDRLPQKLWPWLVQIGYGRAGWYSYDWIDNDGKPSLHHIEPAYQVLQPGDQIQMVPGFGPRVVEISVPIYILAGDADGGTWCLAVVKNGSGSRLISRWRQDWKAKGIAARFFTLIADPGAFIMERKMLLGVKRRAESEHPSLQRQQTGFDEVA